MDRHQRVATQRHPLGGQKLRRQVVTDVADDLESLGVEIAELLLRDVLARRIDRREVPRFRLPVEVVRGNGEAVAIRLPPNADVRPWRELALEPGLVEPAGLDLTRLVDDPRCEDRQPAAAATGGGADLALDHGLVVAEEVADPLQRDWLLVTPRSLPED